MGDIGVFVNTLESRLASIPGLRVYDRPVTAVNEFPCAIIEDHDPLAQYTVSSNEAVYFLTITVLHSSSDIREAWEGLEPYLSASGAHLSAGSRRPHRLGGRAGHVLHTRHFS